MSTELARVPAGIVPLTLDDLERAMHMAGRAAGVIVTRCHEPVRGCDTSRTSAYMLCTNGATP